MRCLLSRSYTSPAIVALTHANRTMVGRVPSKGVREQPPVPDRLKDAIAYFGNQANVVMEDTPFVPQEKRQNLIRETMSMHQNMKSVAKLDRLRVALAAVYNRPCEDEGWNEVYLFLRTMEYATELKRVESDVFPKGSKLWIELENCEERREPYFMKLPNGMVVLPVFSFEEYLDYYFSRLDIFEAAWFPVPRMGSRYEAFCKMEFPVCALGPIKNFSALSTMSLPASPIGVMINPGQRGSKFLTYPEMVYLAKQKKGSLINDGTQTFHPSLKKVFDTVKMDLVRMSPDEVREYLKTRPNIPPVAQLELQLLIFPFADVAEVYSRTVKRSTWKQVIGGGSPTMTQLDIVVYDTDKSRSWRVELAQIIRGWSYMAEFNSDVHIEFTTKKPDDPNAMKLYDHSDGTFYRQFASYRGMSLRQALDFDAPLKDTEGKVVDTGPPLKR